MLFLSLTIERSETVEGLERFERGAALIILYPSAFCLYPLKHVHDHDHGSSPEGPRSTRSRLFSGHDHGFILYPFAFILL